jgi:hypothetical protein
MYHSFLSLGSSLQVFASLDSATWLRLDGLISHAAVARQRSAARLKKALGE